jgi:prepilin-type N-terminal cleavage/methylation domain-containing protein
MGYRVNNPDNAGFTLLELILAISLAAITTSFIFSSYIDVVRGFKLQVSRAERVREMVQTKNKICKAFLNIGSLVLVAPNKIVVLEVGDTTTHSIEYFNSDLYYDAKLIQNKLYSFVFQPSDKKNNDGLRIIEWEGVLNKGGWVGGVFIAKDLTP